MAYRTGLGAAQAIHAQCNGGKGWYAGVTNKPDRRLREHAVDVGGACGIVECETASVAAEAEKILHEWGYEGQSGGGTTDDSFWVYTYKITPRTVEGR